MIQAKGCLLFKLPTPPEIQILLTLPGLTLVGVFERSQRKFLLRLSHGFPKGFGGLQNKDWGQGLVNRHQGDEDGKGNEDLEDTEWI